MKKMTVPKCLKLIYENRVIANAINDIPKEELKNFILEIFNKGILNGYLLLDGNPGSKPQVVSAETTIKFWMDNLTSGEYDVSLAIIASDFINSEECRFYRQGMMFERCLLTFLARQYGTFERITDQNLSALFNEVELNIKNEKR